MTMESFKIIVSVVDKFENFNSNETSAVSPVGIFKGKICDVVIPFGSVKLSMTRSGFFVSFREYLELMAVVL